LSGGGGRKKGGDIKLLRPGNFIQQWKHALARLEETGPWDDLERRPFIYLRENMSSIKLQTEAGSKKEKLRGSRIVSKCTTFWGKRWMNVWKKGKREPKIVSV